MANKRKYIILSIGIILFVFGMVKVTGVYLFIDNAAETDGRVIEVKNDPVSSQKYVYVLFTADGRSINHRFPISRNKSYLYPVGSSIHLLYNPYDPREVEINSFFKLWSLPLIFTGGGIVLFIAAFLKRFTA